MANASPLFTPIAMGDLTLPNRVLMAPLTRNRAQGDGTPKDMAKTYYAQRASAGLILTEASQISPLGKGYLDTPGIYTQAQIAGWREITDTVHAHGGRIFCQLWHVGRISHVSLLPEGQQPVSSSGKAAEAKTFTANGFEACSEPVPLDARGIKATIADYATATRAALDAGFDGIEVHAANGYLIDQFLQDGVNDRTDSYGGSVENRMRFLEEVLDAVTAVCPPGKIGVRLSPRGGANDISDSDPVGLFTAVYKMLDARNLAYLHVVEKFGSGDGQEVITAVRPHYTGFYIANGAYTAESAEDALNTGHAHAVTFGRPFIANPDLPERFRRGAALNEANSDTFYGGDEKGYTDYPFLADDPA